METIGDSSNVSHGFTSPSEKDESIETIGLNSVKTGENVISVNKPLHTNVNSKVISQPQVNSMIKQMKGEACHEYIAPKVDIPTEIQSKLTSPQQQQLTNACLQDYKDAMRTLEHSVADVASVHPDALNFANELCLGMWVDSTAVR